MPVEPRITPADVKASQARYLSGMSAEIKGYQLETCFGRGGCPHRAVVSEPLVERLERVLKKEDLLGFLKDRVAGDLKFHHEFRLAVADCPNACSQPQIRDMGIIGVCVPELTTAECRLPVRGLPRHLPRTGDRHGRRAQSARASRSRAASTAASASRPARPAPSPRAGAATACSWAAGWDDTRASGRELPGIFSEDQVIEILQESLKLYKERSRNGERFAQPVQRARTSPSSAQRSAGRRC